MSVSRIEYLLNVYLHGVSTRQEDEELFSMVLNNKEYEPLIERGLLEYIRNTEERNSLSGELQTDMLRKILNTGAAVRTGKRNNSRFRLSWMKYAAVLVVLVVGGIYLWPGGEKMAAEDLAITEREDIAPGGDKAVLTLADGTTIVLDSAGDGMLTQRAGVRVIKLNSGALAYRSGKQALVAAGGELMYNTISTPRGGQYQLVLADGTKVWLNAASSLRFPMVFAERERRVEVTGEAYFEVAEDRTKPFTVTADSVKVEVLGTSFNVNAYADEGSINTTLVEGAVRMRVGKEVELLKPGQQARVEQQEQTMNVRSAVEVDEIVAWRNGKFVFNETPIENAMRQISRWYNVEVTYQGKVPGQTFNGVLSRNRSLSQILKVLEISQVHFKMEGKRVIVMP